MPSINMIAPRRAETKRLERDMRRLVIVIIAELIFAVGLGGWVCTRMFTTSNRIAYLDTELAKLTPVVRQIEEYDRAKQQLAPKLELLNQAKDCTMRWYDTLDRLTQSMPQSTYLTKISTTKNAQEKSSTTINLNGLSVSQAKIGETMIRLHAIPDFERVDLHYTRNNATAGESVFEFEIGAVMKGSQPAKGAEKNGRGQS